MKKVFLMFAMVGLAACLQAVALNWTAPADADWGTKVTGGALIYTETVDSSANADALLALAKSGTAYEGYTNVTDASGSSEWSFDASDGDVDRWTAVTSKSETGTYFLVLFDDAGNYAIGQMNASDLKDSWTSDVGPGTGTYTPYAPEFTGTLVPEPTALALLALGVAGLALRRRAV